MALSKNNNKWNPHQDIKLDPNQSSFEVPLNILPTVRQCMYIRYIAPIGNGYGSNSDFVTSWIDENKNGPCIPGIETSNDINVIPTIPESFLRTKVTINSASSKKQLIKLTIFLTTGKILAQGTKCKQWRDEEFECLVNCVNYFISNQSPLSTQLQIQVPIPTQSPARISLRLQGIQSENVNPAATNVLGTPISHCSTSCNSLSMPENTVSPLSDSSSTSPPKTSSLMLTTSAAPDVIFEVVETLVSKVVEASEAVSSSLPDDNTVSPVTSAGVLGPKTPPSPSPFFSLQDVEDRITVAIADTEIRVKRELKLEIKTRDQEINEKVQKYETRLCFFRKKGTRINLSDKRFTKTIKATEIASPWQQPE